MNNSLHFSLTQLEYVLALHKFGHFAKAAEACHITQPTLSMQIQKLEEDLEIKLFDRSKKPILLTDIGKKVIEQMQSVLFEAKKIKEIIQSKDNGLIQGYLVMGVIPTIAPYLLPLLLPILKESAPDLRIKIIEMQTFRIVEALESDEIDVGILATPLKLAKIIEYPLYYEPFYVLCQKGHELSTHKKVKYVNLKFSDIWLLEEGHCLRHQVLDICSLKKSKSEHDQFQFESGSLETLKNLVNKYGGYTLLPHLATEFVGQGSQVISFERPIPAREIGLVYRRKYHKNDLIESLADCILRAVPDEIRKIRQKDLDVLPIV